MHLTVMQNKSSPLSGELPSECEAERVERVNDMKIYITGLPSGYEVEHLVRLFYPMAPLTLTPPEAAEDCVWAEKAPDGLREQLAAELAEKGPEAMYAQLQAVDPEAAAAIHPNNQVRVLRALEHYRATGKRLSAQKAESLPAERPYRSLVLGLDFLERVQLYHRIDLRVDKMMENGLLPEAELVYQNRERFKTAAQAIGYKEFFPYFEGNAALEDCVEKLKQASRNYAKRQLTWFRHMDGVVWLDAAAPDVTEQAVRLTQDFLAKG